jgi:Cell division protein 48 (CDC48), N-terminal domain
MKPQGVSLRVLAAYARDVGRGAVRIDGRSMDILGVADGGVVEIIGKKGGTDARCYRLLPSDEDQGIARIDPALRKMIGVAIDHTVTIRKIADIDVSSETPATVEKKEEEEEAERSLSSSPEPTEEAGPGTQDTTAAAAAAAIPSTAAVFVLSGSCIDFEKERPKIMHFITTLESAARSQSKCKCYSDGKKALGWDFFLLELDEIFVDKLRELYPDIQKQEAGSVEERFALWMNKQLMKMFKIDYHLKLSDVPHEKTSGFRLNPEHFRDGSNLEDLR